MNIMALLGTLPIEVQAMQPACVTCLRRVLVITVVIQHAELVTEIDQGNSADRHNNAVHEEDTADRQIYLVFVIVIDGLFKAS